MGAGEIKREKNVKRVKERMEQLIKTDREKE